MAKTKRESVKRRRSKASTSGQADLFSQAEAAEQSGGVKGGSRGAEKGKKSKASTGGKADTESPGSAKKTGARRAKASITYADAETMAKGQREISISEFFAKNRHLLGFDNPRKALLTTIKEAVDNSLDACEEAGLLPWIKVVLKEVGEERFEVCIEDNGPGIVKSQIPNIFGKLLYGSKFHHLKMSRGQQGIGISAAGMYGLLTTGKPVRVTSRTSSRKTAHYYEIAIDTKKNRPEIIKDDEVEFELDHGTRVVIDLEARYQRGKTSIDEYLRQTAIANPHVHLQYINPNGEVIDFPRMIDELPPYTKPIKPHPYGVELGVLMKMARDTEHKTLHAFLTKDFSRVSSRVADEIITKAKLKSRTSVKKFGRHEAEKLLKAIKEVKIMSPSTDCVVPIGEDNLVRGLQSVVKADFYAACTRPPTVYRGNPFVIEAALAYGKPLNSNESEDEWDLGKGEGQIELGEDEGEQMRLFRFANRVPLQYQQSACATFRSVVQTNWRNYRLTQSRGALPNGPVVIIIHVASVWVPFTSESKEAVAHYPEIIKDIKLAIQECGRKLSRYLKREKRQKDELKKRSYIQKYIPHIGIALKEILDLSDKKTDKLVDELKDILEKSRKL